jgi:hypothetical protein
MKNFGTPSSFRSGGPPECFDWIAKCAVLSGSLKRFKLCCAKPGLYDNFGIFVNVPQAVQPAAKLANRALISVDPFAKFAAGRTACGTVAVPPMLAMLLSIKYLSCIVPA